MERNEVHDNCHRCGCWQSKPGEEDIGVCGNIESPDFGKRLIPIHTCDEWQAVKITF